MRVLGTPIKVKAAVLADLVAVWAGAAWLGHYWHPERGTSQSLLVGFVAMVLLVTADFGHAIAHIFSARLAGAPMDQVLISEGMPRTLYSNNDVPPSVHRMRAIGGPMFNALGLLLSLAAYLATPAASIATELAGWSALGHGLLLAASLLPLPIVDGGTLLKWALVDRGATESQADQLLRQLDWGIAVAAAIAGLGLLAVRNWLAGAALMAFAAVIAAIAVGKIR